MKKQILISIFITFLVMTGYTAMAETFTGSFGGAMCTFYAKQCNVSAGHVAMERDFVLNTADGKTYFVLNVDRALKANHLNDKVRVIGKLNKDIIMAERVEIEKAGKYVAVWTLKDEMREMEMKKVMTGWSGG
jgi:hypothetical protein